MYDIKDRVISRQFFTKTCWGDSLVFDELTVDDKIYANPEDSSEEYVLLEIVGHVTHK